MRFWRKTTVLGKQLADAQDAEAERLAIGNYGRSPMPNGEYSKDQGDYSLLSVAPLRIDIELRSFVDEYANWDSERREHTRASISMKELYTLIHFAKRSAVMALSERSRKRCEEGLIALTIIDEKRIDYRDAAWAAGLLSCASTTLKLDVKGLIRQASSLSTKGMRRILKRQSKSPRLSDWGYSEVETGNGVGLIKSDDSRYEPTLSLTEIAIDTARQLSDGRYFAEPTIATKLPHIWFPSEARSLAETALENALGTVLISGDLRNEACDTASQQTFSLWIAEMPNERESENLRSLIGDGVKSSERFVVAFSVGQLFGLGVAGSWVQGISSFETHESLADLVGQIETQLTETVLR